MDRMPNASAKSGDSSMLTLATRETPASIGASCRSIGAICRQGPHHGAQKSTSSGPEQSFAAAWKLSVVSSMTAFGRVVDSFTP